MVSTDVNPLGATVQAPPIVKELQSLFDNLDDTPLLQALIGKTRRGPKGHPVYTLWRCFLAKHYLSMPSAQAQSIIPVRSTVDSCEPGSEGSTQWVVPRTDPGMNLPYGFRYGVPLW